MTYSSGKGTCCLPACVSDALCLGRSPFTKVPWDQGDSLGPGPSQRGPLLAPVGWGLCSVEKVRQRGAAVQAGPGDKRERLRSRACQRGTRAGVPRHALSKTKQVNASVLVLIWRVASFWPAAHEDFWLCFPCVHVFFGGFFYLQIWTSREAQKDVGEDSSEDCSPERSYGKYVF